MDLRCTLNRNTAADDSKAMHPKTILRYLSLNPFEVKKLAQILLGSQYEPGLQPILLKQLFKDLRQLNGIQLQWVEAEAPMFTSARRGWEGGEGLALEGSGPEPIAAYLWIRAYDNEGDPDTEIGIEIEYEEQTILGDGIKIRRENKQYASFAYTGATLI